MNRKGEEKLFVETENKKEVKQVSLMEDMSTNKHNQESYNKVKKFNEKKNY